MKKYLFLLVLPLVFAFKLNSLAADYETVLVYNNGFINITLGSAVPVACYFDGNTVYFVQSNGNTTSVYDMSYGRWISEISWGSHLSIVSGFIYPTKNDALDNAFSHYDSSIQMGTLWHTSLKTKDNGYAWVVCGSKPFGSTATDFLVTLRVNGSTKTSWHENALGGIYHFDYASYGIVNGDLIEIYATPYDENNNWGDSKSISWYANVNIGSVSITDVPNLTPTVNGNPITINPETVVQYRGTTSTIIQTTTVYTQNTTIVNEGITEELLQSIIDSIQTNINNYYGDTVTNVITNNYYNYSYNYFDDDSNESRQLTFNDTKESFINWIDSVVSSIGVLNGTCFSNIFTTLATVLGIVSGIALLFVIIKIVGLIL